MVGCYVHKQFQNDSHRLTRQGVPNLAAVTQNILDVTKRILSIGRSNFKKATKINKYEF